MSKDPAKEFETLGEAAARLLAEMVQRAKRRAGQTPAEILEPQRVPVAGMIADGGDRLGVVANTNHRPHSIAVGGDYGNEGGNLDRTTRVPSCHGVGVVHGITSSARPVHNRSDDASPKDRAGSV